MELTLDLILYRFEDLKPHIIRRSPRELPLLGARQFMIYGKQNTCHGTPWVETEGHYLYVTDLSTLWEGRTLISEGMTFLVIENISLSKTQLRQIPGSLILLSNDYEPAYVLNRALRTFEYFTDWDKTMHIATLEGRSIQQLLDLSEELLQYPVVIFDASFEVLAHSAHVHNEYRNFISTVEQGYTDARTMKLIKDNQIFKQLEHDNPLIAPAVAESDKTLTYLRFSGSAGTLGFGAIYHGTSQPSAGYLDIVRLFISGLDLCFQRDYEGRHFGQQIYETFLLNLLHEDSVSESRLNDQLATMDRLNRTGSFEFGILKFDPDTQVPLTYLARTLARDFWDAHIFLNQDHICLLRDMQSNLRRFSTEAEEQKNMSQLLANYTYTFVKSNPFSDLKDIRHAYRQAVFILDWNPPAPGGTFASYSSYLYRDLFAHMEQDMPLALLRSEEYLRLQEYDRAHNTDHLTTVLCYLENDCNATHTANQLFLHRNTIRKIVQLVSEQMHIDLTDTSVKSRLVLSKYIDDFLQEKESG